MFLLSYIINCTVCHIPACWVSLKEGRGAFAPQRPAFQELTPSHTTPTPLFACFPYRFPIQLPSASHQIRGYLQHHVQPGRNTAAAQQWLLVQGGVHAPKHGPLGTAPPGWQLRPGASSALPVCPADLLTVIPEQCWSVSPATPSYSFFFFFLKFFIWIIASLIECCPLLLRCAPPGVNLTHPAFTVVTM